MSTYLAVNLGIGIGIAADAMLATVARARSLRTPADALKWAAAVGLTHWLFPMVGFLGGWYLANQGVARALVYGLGGLLLCVYILQVLRERTSRTPTPEESLVTPGFWLAVWGVSIDALITGPGKAAATAHWSSAQVAFSFPLVGLVVFVLVLGSCGPAILLHRRIQDGRGLPDPLLAMFFAVATWVELLVFSWFAVLSLVETAAALRVVRPSYMLTSACAATVFVTLLGVMWKAVWEGQIEAARAVLRGTDRR